ncbi:MAG: SsrA-binding protein SmpB [Myxococcota bacterium]|nr:SsrA-binding protein SmpB [Myxococcota bacterium]
MAKSKKPSADLIASNRRARHDYAIEETYEAGIVLVGTEVKSLRNGRANIGDAFVAVENGEAWLRNAHIDEYTFGNRFNHEPKRPRKLLLKHAEIHKVFVRIAQKGYTAVPMKMYFKNGYAKLLFGLGKGKKLHDKRQAERAKVDRREARQAREDYR